MSGVIGFMNIISNHIIRITTRNIFLIKMNYKNFVIMNSFFQFQIKTKVFFQAFAVLSASIFHLISNMLPKVLYEQCFL